MSWDITKRVCGNCKYIQGIEFGEYSFTVVYFCKRFFEYHWDQKEVRETRKACLLFFRSRYTKEEIAAAKQEIGALAIAQNQPDGALSLAKAQGGELNTPE